MESIGSIEDRPPPVKEGEFEEGNDEGDEPPPLISPEDDDFVSHDETDPSRIHPLSLWITALLTNDALSTTNVHHSFIQMDLVKQPNAGLRQPTQ